MARKYMNLAEVIEAVRPGANHRSVDKVKFNPDWATELAGVQGSVNKGYALEWVLGAYCMTLDYKGKRWNVLDEATMQPIASYSSIRLGMRGAAGRPSPDAILENGGQYMLVSCKYSKTAWVSGDGSKLVDYNVNELGNRANTLFALMSEAPGLINGNTETIKTNLAQFHANVINHDDTARMWRELCEVLARNGNSLKQLENANRKSLSAKDEVQRYLMSSIEKKFKYHNKVWLNAVMRSGKSYVFAMLASKLTAANKTVNRVALISHFPTDTFRQWKEIFISARQYEDYELFCSNENELDSLVQLKASDKHVLIISAQAIKADPDKWRKYFKTHEYNFIGLDEVHYGYDTSDVQDIIGMIDCKKWLLMSGTIDKLKSRGLVDDDAIVEWTYMDNQLCKKGHNDKLGEAVASNDFYAKFTEADYPTLNIVHAKPNMVLANRVSSLGNADDIQTWDKIYESPGHLKAYVRLLLGGSYVCKREELTKALGPTGRTPVDIAAGHKMIAWYCPNREAQRALEASVNELYDNNPSLPRRLVKVFNSANEDGKFKDELRKLESDDKEYLLILCGQGTTGITYKDMPVIIIGRDCSSITTWLQICFRPMSPMKTATKRYVFDLSFGHVFTDNIQGLLDNNCVNHVDTARREEFFNCVNITDGYDNKWDIEKFLTESRKNMLSSPDKLMKSAISSLGVELGKFIDISNVDLSTPNSSFEASIGEVVKGKTKLVMKKNKKGGKGEIDEEKELLDRLEKDRNFQLLFLKILVKTAASRSHEVKSSWQFGELIEHIINDKSFEETFNEQLEKLGLPYNYKQLHEVFFKKCVKNKDVCDKLNLQLNWIEEQMKSGKPIGDVIGMDELSKKAFSEVYTPPSLVDDMLDKLPKEVWSDPKLKWLDNSCGTGIFLWHGLIPRLMAGLETKIPNEEKRKAHIAGMIYGVDIQLINVGITRSYLVKMLGSENLKTIKKQIVCHDSLTFDYWNDTKFDILVGNPPYNGGVDLKFLTLAIEKLDVKHLLYVHPSTYLIDRKGSARYNKIKNLLEGKLKSATLFNGNPVFNIGLFVPCVIIDYDRDYSGKCSVEYFEDKFKADVNNITKFGKEWATLVNPFMTLMEAECADENNVWDKHIPYSSLKTAIKKNKTYAQLSQIRGHVEVSSNSNKNTNMVKEDFYTLVMKNSNDNKGIRKDSRTPTYEFNSVAERDNFIDYLKSYFARFCLSLSKNKSVNDCGEMALIPWLDFTQSWDDKKLFKHFAIDKETQDYIKNFLPEYYV